jgi:hypothetical protein
MSLQRGSLVRCNYDFFAERLTFKYNYPHQGDYLEVRGLATHHPSGEILCTFEELLLPVPLAAYHFTELQTPDEGSVIIRSVMKFLTK